MAEPVGGIDADGAGFEASRRREALRQFGRALMEGWEVPPDMIAKAARQAATMLNSRFHKNQRAAIAFIKALHQHRLEIFKTMVAMEDVTAQPDNAVADDPEPESAEETMEAMERARESGPAPASVGSPARLTSRAGGSGATTRTRTIHHARGSGPRETRRQPFG